MWAPGFLDRKQVSAVYQMYQLHEYIPHKVKFDMTLIISTALYTASPFENFLQSDLTPK